MKYLFTADLKDFMHKTCSIKLFYEHFKSNAMWTMTCFIAVQSKATICCMLVSHPGLPRKPTSLVKWRHPNCILIIGAYPRTNSVFSNLTLPSLEITRIGKYEFLPTDGDPCSS